MKQAFRYTQLAYYAAKDSQKVRFGLVGVVNTLVDFGILNVLVGMFGVPPIFANIGSTTIAMLVSFSLNKRAVFNDQSGNRLRQLILFFAVTIPGIWLVQSSVLAGMYYTLVHIAFVSDIVALNLAKVSGICVGLVWNYLWYSRVVFKKEKKQ